jgi:hypothetical protein
MAERPVKTEKLLTCEVCLKEIPVSEAKVPEAEDYILFFCGVDCYDAWQKQQSESEKSE